MKTGSINLATVRYIRGVVPLNGLFSIQLKSTDLSASTDFNLQYSNDKTDWCNASEGGVEITSTLVQSETNYNAFSGVPGTHFQILFSGATTGNVNYVNNSL